VRRAGGAALAALALAAAPAALGGRSSRPPAMRLALRPVTSMYEHLEAGFFRRPRGVAVDPVRGEIWIADTQNDRLAIFSADGLPLHSVRPGGEVRRPAKLAVQGDGRVLVLDDDRTRVAVLDWRGRFEGRLELPGLPAQPRLAALALDAEGNLYLGDDSTGQILVYGPERRLRLRFGSRGDGPGQFRSIADIAATAERIVVTDAVATAVQVFDRRGRLELGFGEHATGVANFSLPAGVAVDAAGRILVLDSIRQEIKVFSDSGRFLDRFGGGGRGPGSVFFPEDLAIDAAGRVYVAERGNGRVQVFEAIEVPVAPRAKRGTRKSWKP
jgi:DNA-binding beta-propeller fold protein YncE